MSKWIKVKLGELPVAFIDGDRGKNYPKQQDFLTTGYCLFLNAENVTAEGFRFNSLKFISEEKDNSLRKGKVYRNDVILTTRGTVGNVAIYTNSIPFDNVRINSGMVILRCDDEKVSPLYLYCALRSKEFLLNVNGFKSGVAQPQLPIKDLKQIEIPLPPLPVQRRIADILSAYDDLIENNRRRIAILEETARLAYRKWFGGAEQGRAATLGEICREVRRGVSPDAIAPDTPYIGLEHMPRRSISLCEWESAQKVTSTKLAFEAGDILFGKIRPYFHKVGITFVDGVASSDAIVIKPLYPELHAYVLMTVSSDAFVAAASQGMKGGSKRPRADWKQLLNYSVVMPDDETLTEFNKVLNPILEQLKTLCFSIRNLAAARDMLLPRLMKGESV